MEFHDVRSIQWVEQGAYHNVPCFIWMWTHKNTTTGCYMFQDDDDIVNNKTMVQYPQDSGTLVPSRDLVDGTVLANDTGTLVANSEAGTMLELQSDLGTMVINSDAEEEPTMKSKLMF